MRARDKRLLAAIVAVAVFVAWVVWPANPGIHFHALGLGIDRDIKVRQGLDLSGGVQVLLEADVPASEAVTREQMDAARAIAENRVNALGVVEPNVQLVGNRRILVELPGVADPDEAVQALRGTGLLEFIVWVSIDLEPGTAVNTTGRSAVGGAETASPTPEVTPTTGATPLATPDSTPSAPAADVTPTAAAGDATATPSAPAQEATPGPTPEEPVYRTVLTGKDLKSVSLGTDEYGKPEIDFVLNPEGAKVFAEHTRANVGKFLAITMDGVVISCPQIQTGITEGQGRITGKFTLAEARALVVQLKYGALPVPLKVVERRTVGPTLGQDSVARTTRAGVIGLVVVLLFMLVYYRLPGALADLALIMYAMVTFALFKLIPVTLTLPGLTGFLLSVGMAVDANILIFERMKEELRHGRSLGSAIEAGFSRAWTSIRDSNLSTLITCCILFWFGSTYGASAVKGFAVTLFLGVVVSMFTAVTVTRTFIRAAFALMGEPLREKPWLLGV
ncbi:MAG: protein translocase subunit SecD [Anaerolineae bacterium]|nr:protein translocase subunit SecD [Anaerolineae bacterium]